MKKALKFSVPVASFILLLGVLVLGIRPAMASGTLSLSQTNVSVGVGQSVQVTAYPNGQSIYLASIINTNALNASVSGTQVTITGYAQGTGQVQVCAFDGSCNTVYVTVGSGNYNNWDCTYPYYNNCNNNNYGQVTLSDSNIYLNYGQSRTVTISGGNSSYYLSNNSNSWVASASVSGSQLYVYANNAGSTTMTICSYNSQGCASLYVTVNNSGYVGGITLSENNITLNSGQGRNITISSGAQANYVLSSNSNSSVATASISGNQLYVYGNNYGSTTMSICYSGGQGCVSLYVTVNGGNYGQVTVSESNVYLASGQSRTISVSGGNSSYYISNNTNSSIASASISGSQLYVYGNTTGSTSLTVCSYNTQGCASLYVNVNSGSNSSLSVTTLNLPDAFSNQYYNFNLQTSGGSYPYRYYLSSGSLPSGLTLSSNGAITGYPTQYSGSNFTSNFNVSVYDNNGRSTNVNLTIRMNPNSNSNNQWNWYNQGQVLGMSAYNNGTLVNDNGTIYLIYKNTKTGFANSDAFLGLGYKWVNVINGSTSSLSDSGYIVRSATVGHPWGTWIKSGQTVYFVSQDGLIPVPSYDVFTNNGGNLNNIVDMNYFDQGKTYLPVMTLNDYRLR